MKTALPRRRTEQSDKEGGNSLLNRGLPLYLKLLLILAIILTFSAGGNWVVNQINFQIFPRHEPMLHAILLGGVVIYVVLMAIPFMPGIEVGLGLMLLMGSKAAVVVSD